MKRYLYALRYLISIHVLGLILFTAFRLILFLLYIDSAARYRLDLFPDRIFR